MTKKTIAIILSLMIAVTTVLAGGYTNERSIRAAEVPKTIKMPITVYDHLSDNLLFEYDFGNKYSNELDLENFMEISGNNKGKGLVEETLGENGTPVYKKEVVEKVAQLVKKYMEDTYYNQGTKLYKQLYNQIVHRKNKKNIAELGEYQQSKNKFEKGAGLKDINTCMDYAYYRLNSFWSDTQGDFTKKTDLYSTLQLDLIDKLYKFSNEYKINYEVENKNISQNTSVIPNPEIGFFPLDKNVLGDKTDLMEPYGTEIYNEYDKKNHNYHYSLKAKCEFLYKESDHLIFNFHGDDDVYLFIDGKLALDIGGAHLKRGEKLDVNEIAKKIGLKDGEVYSFDFFYIERHTTASNITIETNMILEQAEAKTFIKYQDIDGNQIKNGDKLDEGKTIFIEYGVTAGNDKMSNVTFKDEDLGVVIGKEGINLGDKGVGVKDKITVTVTDKNKKIKETYTINKDDLADEKKVSEFSDNIGKIMLDRDDTITITGFIKTVEYDKVVASELNVDITADLKQYTDKGTIEEIPTSVSVAPITFMIIPQNTPKSEIKVILRDDKENTLPETVSEGTGVNIVYSLTAQSNYMKSIKIEDEGIGFKIDKEGIVIPNDCNIYSGLTVKMLDDTGNLQDTVTVTKMDIENNTETYKNLLKKLDRYDDSWKMNKGYTIEVTGLNKNIDSNPIEARAKSTLEGPVPTYDNENKKLSVEWKETTSSDSAKVCPKPAYNVTFTIEDETAGSLNGITSYRVEGGTTTGNEPEVHVNPGYKFVKWTQTVNHQTTDVAGNPKDTVIHADTIFKAILEPVDMRYEVRYVDENNKDIAKKKEASAKYKDNVTEFALDIEGYTLKDNNSKNITINTENNKIIFHYVTNSYPYTVKYIDKETKKEIASSFTGSANFGEVVSTNALKIDGYTLEGTETRNITISSKDNTIVYEYVVNRYNVKFVADEHGKVEGNKEQIVKYNHTVESVPTPVPDKGYEFLGWDKTVSTGTFISENPGDELIIENTVFTTKFGPLDYGYIVKYVDEEGNELLTSKQGDKTVFGTIVTENAPEIYGYTVDTKEKSLTIDTEKNEIVFIYTKVLYDVKFTTDGNGDIEGETEYQVKYNESIVKTPTDKAKEGYSFSNWTMIEGDKESVVVEDPSKIAITDNTVFTANYTPNTYNYVIKYVDENGNSLVKDVTKSALYGTEVTESPIEIDGYTTSDTEKTIIIKVNGNEMIFRYKKNSDEKGNDDEENDANKKQCEERKKKQKVTVEDQHSEKNNNMYQPDNGGKYYNSSFVSPKTGYAMIISVLCMFMIIASFILRLSFTRIKKYSRKK